MRQGQGRVAELARSCDPGSEIVENFGRKWEGARERDRERKKKERNRARERVSLSFSFLSLTLALLLSFSQEREREREIFLFSSHRYSFSLADFWSLLLLMPIIKIFYYIWLTELGRETKNSQKDCSCQSSAQDSLFTAFVARVTKILIYAFGKNDSGSTQDRRKSAKFCCPGGDKWRWSFLMMIKIRRGMGIVDMAWLWVWYICRYQFCHPSFQSPTLLECNGPRTERRSISLLSSDKRKKWPHNCWCNR